MNNPTYKIGSCYKVDVTHVNNPHSFYVRSAKVRDEMIDIETPNKPWTADLIEIGQRVIYKSDILNKYIRGDICYMNSDRKEYDLFAIDYGFFEKSILLNHIYSNSNNVNQYPALAMHCRLYLCEPTSNGFTEDVIDTMKEFIGNHTATITIKSISDDKLLVELRTPDCPRDVATMMGLLDYTTYLSNNCSNTVHRFYNSAAPSHDAASALNLTQLLRYKHRKLQVGETLLVRVQSGTSLSSFYVAEVNEYKDMIRGQPSFATYCKDRQMLDRDIVPGKHCAVRVDNPPIYERAIVNKISEPSSKAILQLVDWGKEIEAPFTCIKSVMSEIYFEQPIIAMHCSTDNEPWKTGLPKFLYPGYSFWVQVIELGKGMGQPHKVNIFKKN